MEDSEFLGKLKSTLWENKLAAVLGGVGLLSLGYGITTTLQPQSASSEIIIQDNEEESLENIMVDISGAVEKPGVYELSSDSRVSDAIEAAGGVKNDADHAYIAKNINLAQKVSDGEKIYLPFAGEASAGQVAGDTAGKVSINSGSKEELESLPGIGPVTADKIIKNRPYSSVDDLLAKNSVGASVFTDIKELISL